MWLTTTDPLRIAHWGTRVITPEVSPGHATVEVGTTVINATGMPAEVTVRQSIVDPAGRAVASTEAPFAFADGEEKEVAQSLEIAKPELWSPDSPALYTLRTELLRGASIADRQETSLGLRAFEFDADRGLILNGASVIMRGVCNHHDLGPLGAALWDDALERRLVMLKDMGCNAIRTSHNPPSPELLDLCDRLGFLVIDETFDEWRRGWATDPETRTLASSKDNVGKARFGYHLLFDEWAERDLTDHLMRDRNHPSVILWSVGNEVPEAQKHGELETLQKLREICHRIDPSRPMTVGCNFIASANETGFLELMDVVGYNGGGGSCFLYEADHKRFPARKMYASEVPHSLQTRGEYRTRSRYREPQRQPPHLTEVEVFPETDGFYESSYDNAGVRISARDSWRLTKTLPFFSGEFRWTGFDYIGESLGSRQFTAERDMHMEWRVPYRPGELKAVASRGGEVVATTSTRTAAPAAQVVLGADRATLVRGGRGLCYVTIRIEDAQGNLVPKAANWINLSIQGPGRIVAVGNGDPLSHESFQGNAVRTFNGLALAIIASDPTAVAASAGRKRTQHDPAIVLKASSRSLTAAEVRITSQ